MYLKSEVYRNDLEQAIRGTVDFEKLFHKRILVTGATGMIGSFITDMLLHANRTAGAGVEVYALARSREQLMLRFCSSQSEKNLRFRIQDVTEPLQADICADYIIHAAGDGFPAAFRKHPVETMTPALLGTCQLLQYTREHPVEKFLYISSGEVYGKSSGTDHAFHEEEGGLLDSMDVRNCYPVSKRCGEALCASFAAQYHVPAAVVRLSHVYGACTSAHDNRAVGQFLQNAAAGKEIVLHSAGKQLRSYTYVADCASGILTALLDGVSGEAYNVANKDSILTIAEFAALLSETAKVGCIRKIPDETEEKEHTPIEYAVLDASRLERLGWSGQYNPDKGIKHMLEIRKTVGEIWKQTK